MKKIRKIVFVGIILSMLISSAGCNTSDGNAESDNVRKSTNSDNVSESKNSATDKDWKQKKVLYYRLPILTKMEKIRLLTCRLLNKKRGRMIL